MGAVACYGDGRKSQKGDMGGETRGRRTHKGQD